VIFLFRQEILKTMAENFDSPEVQFVIGALIGKYYQSVHEKGRMETELQRPDNGKMETENS